jgi:hypothetical protein
MVLFREYVAMIERKSLKPIHQSEGSFIEDSQPLESAGSGYLPIILVLILWNGLLRLMRLNASAKKVTQGKQHQSDSKP